MVLGKQLVDPFQRLAGRPGAENKPEDDSKGSVCTPLAGQPGVSERLFPRRGRIVEAAAPCATEPSTDQTGTSLT